MLDWGKGVPKKQIKMVRDKLNTHELPEFLQHRKMSEVPEWFKKIELRENYATLGKPSKKLMDLAEKQIPDDFNKFLTEIHVYLDDFLNPNKTSEHGRVGQNFYTRLAGVERGSDFWGADAVAAEKVSHFLHSAGIKGTRYPSNFRSRNPVHGKPNFVIYRPDLDWTQEGVREIFGFNKKGPWKVVTKKKSGIKKQLEEFIRGPSSKKLRLTEKLRQVSKTRKGFSKVKRGEEENDQ